jgi:lipoprotein LprG
MEGHKLRPAPAPSLAQRPKWLLPCRNRFGRTLVLVGAVCSVSLAAGGCASSTPKGDPSALLRNAKAKVDATSALHFALTSSAQQRSGTSIVSGSGDLARPGRIKGTFTVSIDGFPASVKVISEGGVFTAELPFSSRYIRTDPSRFGLEDPAEFMDPNAGLTRLLVIASDPKMGGPERLSGELLDQVDATVPGKLIPVLPDLAPERPVELVALVNPKTFELRQVRLTGTFTSAKSDSTYFLTLTAYDEHVDITLPAGV